MIAAQCFFGTGLDDPYPLYDLLRADPVQQIDDSGFFVVSTWDAVIEATARPGDFSSNLTATMVYRPDGSVSPFEMAGAGDPSHVLATADDPLHAAHRKPVLLKLAAKRLLALEPVIGAGFEELWTGTDLEWMAQVANRLPMMMVARLLGLPDTDVDELVRCAYASTQLLDGLVDDRQLAAAGLAAMELGGYLVGQFNSSAADPGDNLMGQLARDLDAGTAALVLIQLVAAGAESTAALLGSAAWLLGTRPDVQRQVRDTPALLGAFIDEVLRYESPFRGHYRHVLTDCSLAGTELRAGQHLLLLWGAANRDPRQFDSPNEFRLDRGATRTHLGFGKGLHFCVGAALARLQARTVLGRLLDHTTWLEAPGRPVWLPSVLVRRPARLDLKIN
ncbi:cytochrome P450 [Mycobacterium sp. ITM-2016-00316]|uniref:cytochrome P450 n=1 Tax=Mycobacterium sp. ITM-2016-00316 TaxID=2099695 RepID=UPI000CF9472B|nr:cytochrome P450 [Mycobacterium sp. ITM-2016-00316]WNG80841.1 cytochrome P450 [Mycobacterium sp. ITM-2016-00316]